MCFGIYRGRQSVAVGSRSRTPMWYGGRGSDGAEGLIPWIEAFYSNWLSAASVQGLLPQPNARLSSAPPSPRTAPYPPIWPILRQQIWRPMASGPANAVALQRPPNFSVLPAAQDVTTPIDMTAGRSGPQNNETSKGLCGGAIGAEQLIRAATVPARPPRPVSRRQPEPNSLAAVAARLLVWKAGLFAVHPGNISPLQRFP